MRPRASSQARAITTASSSAASKATRDVRDGSAATSAADRALRDLRRRGCDPRPERQAGLQPLRGVRPHGRREERLQHQPRRHDLLGQRDRRRGGRAHRRRRSGGSTSSGSRSPRCSRLRASAGLYSHWDDHEFINDFSLPEHGEAIYAAGVKAFTDYAPVAKPSATTGPLPHLPLGEEPRALLPRRALVPEREGDAGLRRRPRADGAAGGSRRVRDARTGAQEPGVPACTATLDDPSRTMLGARQYAAFTKAIKASTATWKVIVNEVPIQQYYALPYDRWEGYAAERERLLRFLQANVKNVVFLTTDTHGNLVNEVRYKTFGSARELGHLGGRHRPRRDEHVREGDRRLPGPEGSGDGDRRALLQAARRRTGWECAAPRSTPTATPR